MNSLCNALKNRQARKEILKEKSRIQRDEKLKIKIEVYKKERATAAKWQNEADELMTSMRRYCNAL